MMAGSVAVSSGVAAQATVVCAVPTYSPPRLPCKIVHVGNMIGMPPPELPRLAAHGFALYGR